MLAGHGLSGLWGLWILVTSYHYHNADEKARSMAWDKYHKGLEADGYDIDKMIKKTDYDRNQADAARKAGKSSSSREKRR